MNQILFGNKEKNWGKVLLKGNLLKYFTSAMRAGDSENIKTFWGERNHKYQIYLHIQWEHVPSELKYCIVANPKSMTHVITNLTKWIEIQYKDNNHREHLLNYIWKSNSN